MRLCLNCRRTSPLAVSEHLVPAGWACIACGWRPEIVDDIPMCAPALADTSNGFDPAAFSELERWEEGHFWFEPRNTLIAGLAMQHFPEARSYLEVGCGTGFVLEPFVKSGRYARIVGSELHPSGLRVARQRWGHAVEWLQLDARAIPARGAFDLVGAYDVIEHIAEDELVLREIAAALRPAGGVILSVPQHPFLWSDADDAAKHVRRYRMGELEAKVNAAGLTVVASTSFMSLPLPLMLTSRFLRGRSGSARVAEVEVRPPRLVNSVLRSILTLEVKVALAGLPWPIGGSRVVVARKA